MKIIRIQNGVAVEHPSGVALPIRHVIGIGRNYAAHAGEQGAKVPDRPMVFTKNPAACCVDGDEIIVPKVCQDEATGGDGDGRSRGQVDFEAELGVVIGAAAKDVSEDEALDYVLGYCCANDVSARWWQKQGSGGQFCRGKSFDTFCPMGPTLVHRDEVGDGSGLTIRCRVNGETMQDGTTSDMIFSVRRLVSDLSQGTTLLPGTLILTGTPSGVGMARTPEVYLQDGDEVEIEINGLGVLRNRVRWE
ncbi:MAG: 5-carboxymethyl-2-hydroxymuconate isomerase [Phycisphaerae bacterium]|nr:5-carboxymethyl-2-hydroxymuconate isomerase [Phycisphaerae bacterium]